MTYNSLAEIERQKLLGQQLRNTPRQGHGAGGRADVLGGLAHMLRQYQGGKSAHRASEMAAQNEATESNDLQRMAAVLGGDLSGRGLGPLRENQTYESPGAQKLELSRLLQEKKAKDANEQKMLEMSAGHQNDLGLIGARGEESRQTAKETPFTLGPQQERHQPSPLGAALVAENTNVRPTRSGNQPYFSPLDAGEGGLHRFNHRTGETEPLGLGHKAGNTPELQRRLAEARQTGKLESGRAFSMEGGTLLAARARELLTGDITPTASGAGSLADSVASFFGESLDGAVPASELKTISGWLVSKVPRMEGPQSDFDVENYKTMAGRVGDDKLPIDQRIASLDAVDEILARYAHLNRSESTLTGGGTYVRDENGKLVKQ